MDTYMEKLANKLTAQEMIRANMAAEAEEANMLKSQVRDYHECLKQMEDLLKEGADRIQSLQLAEKEEEQKLQTQLEMFYEALNASGQKNVEANALTGEKLQLYMEEQMNAYREQQDAYREQQMSEYREQKEMQLQADAENKEAFSKLQQEMLGMKETFTRQNVQAVDEMKQSLQEGVARIQAQNDDEQFEKLREEMERVLNAVRASGERSAKQNLQVIDEIKQHMEEQLSDTKKSEETIEQLKRFIELRLQDLRENQQDNAGLDNALDQRFDKAHERIHMECVKVYRNVQAAMVEENEKQYTELNAQLANMKKKMSAVTIFASVGAGAAIVSSILLLLSILHVI